MDVNLPKHSSMLLLVLLVCAITTHAAQLDILFSGSLRGSLFPVDSKLNECTPSSDFIQTWPNCTGGMANRALFIRQKIASNPNTLVLDGGSAFWGSYILQSTASPYYMADLMSLLASHAIAISEADLFNGPEQLGQYIRRVLFQSQVNDHLPAFLASNIDASLEPKLTGLISPYTIITVGSLKVGVFSMIDPMSAYQTSPGPNVYFNTMSGNVNITVPSGLIINNTVAALLTSNCGMIIMMTNVQVDRIKSLWPYPPRIDLILTTAYFNSFVPVTISGYPHVWTTLQSSQITIAGIREIHGSSIVNLTLSFTGNTISLNSIAASLTPLTPQISTNTTFLQAAGYSIGYYADSLQSIHTYIGYTKVAISGLTGSWDSQDCRYTDCQVGRLVTDSLLRWCASCDVAVINAGSIVGSFSAGNISLNQLSQVFAHNDKVSYFSVYGKTLLAALRNMAAQGVGRGSFLQVGGMRFAWNPNMTSTPNLAILEVEVWDRSKSVYSTLKLDQLYKVATTMFYRTGGDDYTMFMDSKQVFNPVDSGPDTQSLVYKYLNESYLFPAFVPVVEPATLQSCYTNASYPLKTKAGGCRIVATSGSIDLSLQCPSNPTVCYSQVSEFGDGVPSTLEGIVANAAMCGRCSGMGQCADQKCTCQQPTTTIFAGLSMVSGADCGIVRRATLLVPAYSGLVYFLGIAGIAIGLMIGFALIVFRNHPAIASTSPIFGVITSIGTCLASAAVIVLSQRVTDSLCQWWLWFTALGFSLAFTPIIVRTYRIHMIFNSNTGSAVIISNLQLGLIIFAVIALDLGVLLWWFFTAPYKAAGMLLPDANSAMIVCGSTSIGTLGFALFGLKAFLLFACVYYAYSVRNVEGNWNESHTIAATIYNATAAFAILLPIIYFVQASSPQLSVLLTAVMMTYVAVFTAVGSYITRFYGIARGRHYDSAEELLKKMSEASRAAPTSQSFARAEREALLVSRDSLMSELADLKSRLESLGLSTEITKPPEVVDSLENFVSTTSANDKANPSAYFTAIKELAAPQGDTAVISNFSPKAGLSSADVTVDVDKLAEMPRRRPPPLGRKLSAAAAASKGSAPLLSPTNSVSSPTASAAPFSPLAGPLGTTQLVESDQRSASAPKRPPPPGRPLAERARSPSVARSPSLPRSPSVNRPGSMSYPDRPPPVSRRKSSTAPSE